MNSVSWPVEETKKVHLEKVNLFVYAEGLRNVVDTAASRYHGKKGALWRFSARGNSVFSGTSFFVAHFAPAAFFVGFDRLFCFRQPFSHFQLPPLRPRGQSVPNNLFSRPAASLRPRCHFVPSRPTAPFSRTSEPYSVPDNLFPVLLQSLFFSGSSWKLSPCPPPPVIYDALWPRCTRWRAEPSSAAPWESIYR